MYIYKHANLSKRHGFSPYVLNIELENSHKNWMALYLKII